MRADWFYEPCARCGDQAGRFAHKMAASGRLICGRCWRDLKFDASGRKVDDGRTPETLERGHTDISTSYPPDVHKV